MLTYFLSQWPTLFHTQTDWTHGLDLWTESWIQLLNNNPGIIHFLQYWRHQYRAITAGTALPYKSDNTSACTNQLEYTYDTHVLA